MPITKDIQASDHRIVKDVKSNYKYDTEFIILVKTDNAGASNNDQFAIPTNSGSVYSYDVDWGDGNTDTGLTGNETHTYSVAGTYKIKISGTFPRIYFNNVGDKEKLLKILNWGNIQWDSFERAFYGCINLDVVSTDTPNLSQCTRIRQMFKNCTSLEYNSTINIWDIILVDEGFGNNDMAGVFQGCTNFNQDLSNWNTSKAISFNFLFQGCTNFNQDLSNWNTSKVFNFASCFRGCINFNQDLSNWDFSGLTYFLSSDLNLMLNGTALTVANYDNLLISMSTQDIPNDKTLGAVGLNYTSGGAAEAARTALINDHNWTILDGGGT